MFANPLGGFRAGQAKVDGEVSVWDAFAGVAVVPSIAIAGARQGAKAFRAEAQVGGEHFLLAVIQAFPSEKEGFCLILFQQRFIGLRVRTDSNLLPAVLQLSVTGSVAAVNICAAHVLQGRLDQCFCLSPVNSRFFPDIGYGFGVVVAPVFIENRHDLPQFIVSIISLHRAASPHSAGVIV